MEQKAVEKRIQGLEEDYRHIRSRLSIAENDHLLTAQRMFEIHQELCRLHPKKGPGFNTAKGYTHYDLGNLFVREHLASKLSQMESGKEELSLARGIFGRLFSERPESEKIELANAAKGLLRLGGRGKAIFSLLQNESNKLVRASGVFQIRIMHGDFRKDYHTDLFSNPVISLIMHSSLEDFIKNNK